MDLNNDIIKIHIWQLSEKTGDINISKDYMIIHDGFALKKIKVENLYNYFNQDYKIDNTIKQFVIKIQNIDDTYEVLYTSLELSLDNYEKLISELSNKFKVNRDNIRSIETRDNQLQFDIDNTIEIFENIEGKQSTILSTFDNFSNIISILKSENINHTQNIEDIKSSIFKLTDEQSQLYITSGDIKKQISSIHNYIESDSDEKRETLIKNIYTEYDKILAIIDYYHHIHDNEII